MLHEALKQLLKWQPDNIQTYCKKLIKNPIEELLELGFKIEDTHSRASHLFGIRLPESMQISSFQHSFKKNKVSVSFRGDAIRVSPNVYNDELDMRKLLKAMKEPILAGKK